MTPQSYEVTHSDSALVTAHQAQIRRVIAEEHGAVQIRPA